MATSDIGSSIERPSETEIMAQLERMIASDHFRTADTQSKLLSLAVNREVRGESLSEYELGVELFGQYDEVETHKVRVHASNVRKKINQYYDGVGRDDLVRIELPPGRAYKPSLTYHVQSEAVRKFKQALALRNYGSRMSLMQAIELLKETVELAPTYAPAYSALAECTLLGYILTDITGNIMNLFPSQGDSYDFARKAVELNEYSWSGHISLGAGRLLHFNWTGAGRAFDIALKLDANRTRTNLWYGAYLMTIGQTAEALKIAADQAKANPDNFMLHLVVGCFFYVAQKFGTAMKLFFEVDVFDARRDWRHALTHLLVDVLNRDEEFDTEELNHATEVYFEQILEDAKLYKGKRLRAFEILHETGDDKVAAAERMFSKMRKTIRRADLDLAVAYLGIGRHARAIVALRRAYRNENVVANWFHLLPIFSPLQGHPRFRELITIIADKSTRRK